jgi:hypothetical protein
VDKIEEKKANVKVAQSKACNCQKQLDELTLLVSENTRMIEKLRVTLIKLTEWNI